MLFFENFAELVEWWSKEAHRAILHKTYQGRKVPIENIATFDRFLCFKCPTVNDLIFIPVLFLKFKYYVVNRGSVFESGYCYILKIADRGGG